MNRLGTARAVSVLALVALGASACGGGSTGTQASSASTSAASGTKAAFCAADVTIDKAGAQAQSGSDFLSVLKNNAAALSDLQKNAPAGKVGTEAKALVQGADAAVAANDPSKLAQVPGSYGADVDTYCGVDGNGNILPSYFGAGKGTPICSVNSQINAGTNAAQSPADVLAFLKAHPNLVSQFAADVADLPGSIKSTAQSLVSTAQQAIATNNADLLSTNAVTTESMDVSLYCGQNQ